MARIITITSGKGGVGKTSISVNLALCLARMEQRVCLFDADLGLANVDLLLGLRPEKTLRDVVFGGLNLDDVIISAVDGMDIVPGSSGIAAMADLDSEHTGRLIQALEGMREYDYLLIDTSAGISQNVISFGLASPEVLLMMAPEITAVTDAYALLKLLLRNGFDGALHVVVNRCRQKSQGRQVFAKFHGAVQQYLQSEVSLLGIVAEDPQVEAALKVQQPFAALYPDCPAAAELIRMAGQLLKTPPPKTPGIMEGSYWQRWIETLGRPLQLSAPKISGSARRPHDSQQSRPKDAGRMPQTSPPNGVHRRLPSLQSKACEDREPATTASLGRASPSAEAPGDISHSRLQLSEPLLAVLPQTALACMQACRSGAPLEEIARRTSRDAALCVNIFALDRNRNGDAPQKTDMLEGAVVRLGRQTVETLALHAVHFEHLDGDAAPRPKALKTLWQHSLQCAELSRLLAQGIGFRDPQAAYLAGLLHDTGKLLPNTREAALRKDPPIEDICPHGNVEHARTGARLLAGCGLPTLLTDAVCYHHAPPEAIRNAFGLVKIVYAANALCSRWLPPPATRLEESARILALPPAKARRMAVQAWESVADSARLLDIRLDLPTKEGSPAGQPAAADHQRVVFHILRERALLAASLQPVLEVENPVAVHETISRTLQLFFTVPPALFFSYEQPSQTLSCQAPPDSGRADLRINTSHDCSLPAVCCRQRRIVSSFEEPAQIMDEQLAHLLNTPGIVCIPLVFRRFLAGVMVVGADAAQAERMRAEQGLLDQLARQGACALLPEAGPTAAA